MLHSLTFRSRARKPRTMVTTVGTSMQENNRRNDRSRMGKSLSGGIPNTIGLAMAGKGIKMHCPPGLGTGTVNSKWDTYRSRGKSDDDPDKICKCDRNRLNADQKGYRLMRQIVLFSNVIMSSKPVSRMSSCKILSPYFISSNPTMRLLLSSLSLLSTFARSCRSQ